MYINTPLGRVIALDAATGRQQWIFDPEIRRDITYGDFASRGIATWVDSAAAAGAPCRLRIFVTTAQSQLFALDAGDGRPCRDFAGGGPVDLKDGLRIPPFEPAGYSMTSPPIVINGVVITGSSIGDNSRPAPASGEVRGFDARTGRLKWSWDPIPQDPADPAYGEWQGELGPKTGAANAWTGLAADAERDLVFIPTGSAAPTTTASCGWATTDTRTRSSRCARRPAASCGHFKPSITICGTTTTRRRPALATITRDGARVPVVVQANKTGMLYVLDRETGRPVFPVEERRVPDSAIPEETGVADAAVRDRDRRRSAPIGSRSMRCGVSTTRIVRRAAP